jgi:hypothetical protein
MAFGPTTNKINESQSHMLKSEEENSLLQFAHYIVLFLLLILIFLRYLYPVYVGRDTDIFWHIKTGQVIVNDGRIPSSDPFTYTPKDNREREQFLLKSYWLADVIFYSLYKMSGFTGIVVTRSVILCLTVLIVYLAIRKRGFFTAILLSLLLGFVFMPVAAPRPNLFSFFFAAVIVFFMERFREERKRRYQVVIIGTMLLWVNMHGGYLIGVGILASYAAVEIMLAAIKRGRGADLKTSLSICATAGLGIAATLVSPLGTAPLFLVLDRFVKPSHNILASHIETEMGLFKNVIHHPNEMVLLSLLLSGIILVYTALNLTRRKAGLTETAVVLSLFLLTVFSVRAMPIFLTAGLIISVGKANHKGVLIENNKYVKAAGLFIMSILLVLLIWMHVPRVNLGKLVETDCVYLRLGDFLDRNQIKGNMLNREFTGNYLIFRLYPRYKVFTDSRYLNADVFFDGLDMFYAVNKPSYQEDTLYLNSLVETCLHGLRGEANKDDTDEYWRQLLDKYDIDYIVGRISHPSTGQLFPLFLKLMHDDAWQLVYMDGNSVIMVKDNQKNGEILQEFVPRDKRLLYNEAILENINKDSPEAYETLAYAFFMKGDKKDAEVFARDALHLNNNMKIARACLEQMRANN